MRLFNLRALVWTAVLLVLGITLAYAQTTGTIIREGKDVNGARRGVEQSVTLGSARVTSGTIANLEVTLTMDPALHAAGDVLAATQAIASAVRVNAGKAELRSLVLLDQDDIGAALDIVLLRTNVAIGAENAPVSITDADAVEILGVIEVSAADYVDLVASQVVHKKNLGIQIEAGAGSTSLYIAAIARGAPTPSANGIVLKLGLLQE